MRLIFWSCSNIPIQKLKDWKSKEAKEIKCLAFFSSFVYGSNDRSEREALWVDLGRVKPQAFWLVVGVFLFTFVM